MRKNNIFILLFIFVLSFILSGCGTSETADILLPYRGDSRLEEALREVFPGERVDHYIHESVLSLKNGVKMAEVYYREYEHLKDRGYNLYPIYYETPIIAINRDLTDAEINSWADLRGFDGNLDFYGFGHYSIIAMAYNKNTKSLDFNIPTEILKPLYAKGKLSFNSFPAIEEENPPGVMVLLDHEATYLMSKGYNLELVLPEEGSIGYKKALITKETLSYEELAKIYSGISERGYRSGDGSFNKEVFGDLNYENTLECSVIDNLNDTYMSAQKSIWNIDKNIFISRNHMENFLKYLALIVIVALWGMYSYFRLSNGEIRVYILLISFICIFWIICRMIRLLSINTGFIHRFSWYLYYVGLIFIPLISMWIAFATEKAMERERFKRFRKYSTMVAVFLLIMVLTNDLHNLVFDITYSSNRDFKYTFGIMMGPILAWEVVGMISPLFILARKSYKMPDKRMIIPPVISIAALIFYFLIFVLFLNNKFPTELTRTVVLICLLTYELCMQFGLLPMNKKYATIFEGADVSMVIKDYEGNAIFKSKQVENEGDFIVLENTITGGTVEWKEDISEINSLSRSIELTAEKLRERNEELKKKYVIERKIETINKKNELIARVENTIQNELTTIDEEIKSLRCYSEEEKRKKFSIMGYRIAELKQKSNNLLLSLIENNLTVDNVLLACRTIAKAALGIGVSCSVFCNYEGSIDFDTSNLLCSWYADCLENLAYTDSEVIGNYTKDGDIIRLTMFTDNENIESNPFNISEALCGDLERINGTLVLSSDDEGYRAIMEVQMEVAK